MLTTTAKAENINQQSDLVQINEPSENQAILIYAYQLNRYFHTLLGHPFQRVKYYHALTEQYHFYRTPGILNYVISYYLHEGCLSTETTFPAEILYDELVFFGFNIQIIYEIVSNIITMKYYIPSDEYRRAFWLILNDDRPENPLRLACGLITLSSILTSLSLLELINLLLNHTNPKQQSQLISIMHRVLITELIIALCSATEYLLRYFIRPKIPSTTLVFLLIHTLASLPITLFVYLWSNPPTWLYTLLVLQLAARIIRSARLSSQAYQILHVLSSRASVFVVSFQSIVLIVLFFGLIMLAAEQVSAPVEFIVQSSSTSLSANASQSLGEIVWIAFNAFTAVGEGTSRPTTRVGLLVEFFTCFLGILTIPHLVQTTYIIVSNVIDEQRMNEEKRWKKHLVMIEDEHGNRAIGQLDGHPMYHGSLPEILIQQDEF